MSDLELDWQGAQVSEVFPKRIPYLFCGRPVAISGRFEGAMPQTITLMGNAMGSTVRYDVKLVNQKANDGSGSIAKIWARTCIADLDLSALKTPAKEIEDLLLKTALDFGIVSRRTALLAVDSLARPSGEPPMRAEVPVHVPRGVRFDVSRCLDKGH